MVSSEFLDMNNGGLSIGLATPTPEVLLTPNIGVIGVGGAGGNAVNNMVASELSGVSFFVANTDAQALSKSLISDRIQLGVTITQGLGAGANPEVGRAAAEEAEEKIKESLKGLHLLFITAGMGGGTGTGAAPVIAKLAKDMGILTVAVVSKPFQFEGMRRTRTAEHGIEELKKYVDTLLVIPNQNLFRIIARDTTMTDAFKIADGVLCEGVRSVTDLIIKPGNINVDFADLKRILSYRGRALMGNGEASGENRAEVAVEKAIANPLLDNASIQGAKGVLLNISGGLDLTLPEVEMVSQRIGEELGDEEAEIILGTCSDEALHGKIRVSFIATGIDEDMKPNLERFLRTVQPETVIPVPMSTPQPIMAEETHIQEEPATPVVQQESEVSLPGLEETQTPTVEEVAQPMEVPAYQNHLDIVSEVTEKPASEPALFKEEVPQVPAAVEVRETPDLQPEVSMESKKADVNVKPIRDGGLFRDLIPGFMIRPQKKVEKPKEEPKLEATAMPVQAKEPTGFSDSFASVDDLPSFLRRG